MSKIITGQFLKELESEEKSTRMCLERITDESFNYKPHQKSMLMGYLALLVADIPKWIAVAIDKGEINFATWEKYSDSTVGDLVGRFNQNMAEAKAALQSFSDENLEDDFLLQAGDQLLAKDSKRNTISSSINHMAHHRGQLTVYMRLNNIPVPSIYGPSADDKTF
ncbi:MAG TPA: DinB family protein [Candidatus Paceibacterota bacterium]